MSCRLNLITRIGFHRWLRPLLRDARGQDLIEYALVAAALCVAAGAVFPTQIVPGLSSIMSKVLNAMPQ